MKSALLIFPHQLFENHPGLKKNPDVVILSEDTLFFGDRSYPSRFHKQKLAFHRASMKSWQSTLMQKGYEVSYFEYAKDQSQMENIYAHLKAGGYEKILICDPVDFILVKRLKAQAARYKITLEFMVSPGWLNSRKDNQDYRDGKKRWFMADFYQHQRRRLDILMDGDKPTGEKWSFDEENRKKVPKKLLSEIPKLRFPAKSEFYQEAEDYVIKHFPNNPGMTKEVYYPINHADAKKWLADFLKHRLNNFGPYEDAIVAGQNWLWHSVLTPLINTGLLTPNQVIKETIKHCQKYDVPLPSLEGFVRQIIGWREFMRATYEDLGVTMRNGNHWNHHNKMPSSFYSGATGIEPIDDTVNRILKTGYCHHIERLMILGGFMFLCEIDPNEIYKWFMELFIDSYDWVMVPNVYAMSQNADGGLITTKPYFSGSNYVRKMGHYPKGEWADIWDALYWRWIINHSDELRKNPRWSMMVRMADKLPVEKKEGHFALAENFLKKLHH